MIAYLPEIYPDELVYSWFCRYYVHTGCLTHKAALQELLNKRCNNPSKEFIGQLHPEAKAQIEKMYSMDMLVLEHTMFPQYARFIPATQKREALDRLAHDACDAHHLFSILPRSANDHYLKYCPLCVQEDRHQYGETYWHRVHQLRNMQICPAHKCKLVSSSVTAKSEQTFTLCPAESYALVTEATAETAPQRIEYASYVEDVFYAPVEFEEDTPASAILYAGMQGTKYLKSTGRTRQTRQLAEDMQSFYSRLKLGSIASMSQIQRIWTGDRFDFSAICQIAFFLGMDVKTLINPKLTDADIAQERDTHYMTDKEPIDWAAYDAETAPVLEMVARAIYDGSANESGRPGRVSERAVYREMGFPGHRLENLPQCRAVFDRYSETYEESWARRIVWAYRKLSANKEGAIYWSDIRTLAGVKKKNINKILPHLKKYADAETLEMLLHIIN